MNILAALSPQACLPWLLAMLLLHHLLRLGRVVETVKATPVAGDRGAMLQYCTEVERPREGQARRGPSWQSQMVWEGAHAHILRALEEFQKPSDAPLATSCLNALCSMALFNHGTSRAITHAGALMVVLDTGLGFSQNADVLGVASTVMGCLVETDGKFRPLLRTLGGHQFALDTWRRHPDHIGALAGAGALIAGMSYSLASVKWAFVDELEFTMLGLDSIRRFPKTEDRVREQMMLAFHGLSGWPPAPDVQARLVEDGLLQGLVTVLRENGDGMATVTNANRVVQNMGMVNNTYRVMMLDAGIGDLIIGRLGAFGTQKGWAAYVDPDTSGVQALASLAKEGEDNRRRLVEAGAIEKVQEVMKMKPHHTGLQGAGRGLLDLLKDVKKSDIRPPVSSSCGLGHGQQE
eukprot:CAMPEP_0204514432 /NCGR_PEP_ID=MMETSP0661-20131031/2067_1 /ASSEMBLY_ACC=CAM_ASM_000606 /TAXON_ID=109239 /ORGANISM="Alexandrium margalefi, Strain AMGDE01CS-322" /LENGTH=405 /DNA_ID=CAMNT_0051519675 /DNA_START=89 /DNA_END=1304 /DNA_ORIENTATION=-